jgi:ankyrin repeat protein
MVKSKKMRKKTPFRKSVRNRRRRVKGGALIDDFFDAIYNDDVAKVRKMLPEIVENEQINTARKGTTPLHLSVLRSNKKIVRLLLDNGADPNVTINAGLTPLFSCGNSKIATQLLSAGANPNYGDLFDNTPLHYIIQLGDVKLIKILIDNRADVNARNLNGDTPLFGYFENYNHSPEITKSVFEYMIKHGADVNLPGVSGRTCLHLVALYCPEFIPTLLEAGADPNAIDHQNNTPLYINARSLEKTVESILTLYFAGNPAYIYTSNLAGDTPLACLLNTERYDIVDALVENGVNPNIDLAQKTNEGRALIEKYKHLWTSTPLLESVLESNDAKTLLDQFDECDDNDEKIRALQNLAILRKNELFTYIIRERPELTSIQRRKKKHTINHFLASIGKKELLKETLQQSGASKKLKRLE